MKKAALKDISSIVIRLTVTCLLAGFIMGLTFVLTHDAKERNEVERENRVMYSLLGYEKVPDTMALHTIYRYIFTKNEVQSIGYVVPVKGDNHSYILIELDLSGLFMGQKPLTADESKIRNASERLSAVQAVMDPETDVRYADNFMVVTNNGQRTAYILDGKYPGFKTTIRVKMALDANYSMLGFEVLEHEEDPGLGAEIEQKWFRGQFDGKSFEQLKSAQVIRKPMPDDLRAAITAMVQTPETARIREEHRTDDIYALTGATISSRSVLNGNQAMVRKFNYRMKLLDEIIQAQAIQTTY